MRTRIPEQQATANSKRPAAREAYKRQRSGGVTSDKVAYRRPGGVTSDQVAYQRPGCDEYQNTYDKEQQKRIRKRL